MPDLIVVRGLRKQFPNVLLSLGGSLTVAAGEVFGLLGPNGHAGIQRSRDAQWTSATLSQRVLCSGVGPERVRRRGVYYCYLRDGSPRRGHVSFIKQQGVRRGRFSEGMVSRVRRVATLKAIEWPSHFRPTSAGDPLAMFPWEINALL
jgi:hypothetical protein